MEFDLDFNNILTLIISAYAALLSTFLAVKGYMNKQAKLDFIYKFKKDDKGHFLELQAQNSSDRGVVIHEVSFTLGETKAVRRLDMDSKVHIEPSNSEVFKLYLPDNDEYLLKVDSFDFHLANGKIKTYKLGRTIIDAFRLHVFTTSMPDLFLEIERVDDGYKDILRKYEASNEQAEDIKKRYNKFVERN